MVYKEYQLLNKKPYTPPVPDRESPPPPAGVPAGQTPAEFAEYIQKQNTVVSKEQQDDEAKKQANDDIISTLRPLLPNAGTMMLDDQDDNEETDILKASNMLMGQVRPLNWPLGNIDNPLWVGNMAREGLLNMGEMFDLPPVYSGGTLTDGAPLYGMYIKHPF